MVLSNPVFGTDPKSQVLYLRGPISLTIPRYTTVLGRGSASPSTNKYKYQPRPIPKTLLAFNTFVDQHTRQSAFYVSSTFMPVEKIPYHIILTTNTSLDLC